DDPPQSTFQRQGSQRLKQRAQGDRTEKSTKQRENKENLYRQCKSSLAHHDSLEECTTHSPTDFKTPHSSKSSVNINNADKPTSATTDNLTSMFDSNIKNAIATTLQIPTITFKGSQSNNTAEERTAQIIKPSKSKVGVKSGYSRSQTNKDDDQR
uniref:Uncharacterized protein n=1 Tax=Ciona savignyi TaxID=51511 RepID=H2YU47_CIOSA